LQRRQRADTRALRAGAPGHYAFPRPKYLPAAKRTTMAQPPDQPEPFEPELIPEEPRATRSFEGFEREDEAWLRLSFVNMTARHCRLALARWGTPHALLEAAARGRHDELLATRGLSQATVERLAQAAIQDISPALRAIEQNSIWLLREGDPLYPPALRAIEDAPVMLWVRGTLAPQDEIAVGIVGTRDLTEYGRGMAGRLARDLAERGVTIVSGLAIGVDTYAHRGALDGGGRTLACCGCGLDIIYPRQNEGLMRDIIESGAMISEFAPTMKAQGWHFPARNRIISGLSAGIVVIEAAERSGALITAAFAREQDREVFALPGNVLKVQSRGPHGLIREGATLIEKAQDILDVLKARSLPFERAPDFTEASAQAAALAAQAEEDARLDGSTSGSTNAERVNARSGRSAREQVLEPAPGNRAEAEFQDAEREAPFSVEAPRAQSRTQAREIPEASAARASAPMPRTDLSAEENRVLGALDWQARHIDEVALAAGMGPQQIMSTLLMLEIKRLARRLPGGMFERLE